MSSETPEGHPSIIPPMALPWDSPKLVKRKTSPNEFELIENKNRKLLGVRPRNKRVSSREKTEGGFDVLIVRYTSFVYSLIFLFLSCISISYETHH
tara:strand:+ start:92 stop:379 length:288 start_codon:yes stop_codon:yes gene_type:complete